MVVVLVVVVVNVDDVDDEDDGDDGGENDDDVTVADNDGEWEVSVVIVVCYDQYGGGETRFFYYT